MGRRKEPTESRNRKILNIAILLEKGLSFEKIRTQASVGKNLIGTVKSVMSERGLSADDLAKMAPDELDSMFSTDEDRTSEHRNSMYEEPDYEYLEKELMKPGVTRQLLWEEYRDDCIRRNTVPYQITQFKLLLSEHIKKQPYAALIIYKPGVLMEVDWTGDRAHWLDPFTGEDVYGWLFIGVLAFSGLAFARVYPDMKKPNWINAHAQMFNYFHGVTPTLRCDNLKTGVISHSRSGEYVLQSDYKGIASYYGIVIVPAAPLSPKEKALAENTVKYCEQRLLAALRNEKCCSLEEYNQKLAEKLEEFNNRPFQKKEGSRRRVYELYEKETLCRLPEREYEYCDQVLVKVQSDGFVGFDKNFYSVPEKRPGDTVALYAFFNRIELYDGLTKLAVHDRAPRGMWKKVYDPAHFRNTNGGNWSMDRFLRWAEKIGPATYMVVSGIFKNGPEQVYYSSVHSLLKLTDTFGKERLEKACGIALRKMQRPSYRSVKTILTNNMDLRDTQPPMEKEPTQKRQEYSYLGGNNTDNGNG